MKTRTIIASCLLLVFGIAWVLMRRPDKTGSVSQDSQAVSLEVQIRKVEVRPTGDHAQLILTAVFRQSGQTPVRLEPPLVSLRSANQTPAARYLGPMLPEPVLKGPEPTEIALHYWLPVAELETPLALEAAGRRYPVNPPPLPQDPAE